MMADKSISDLLAEHGFSHRKISSDSSAHMVFNAATGREVRAMDARQAVAWLATLPLAPHHGAAPPIRYYDQWEAAICGRMVAESAVDVSDAEIVRTLSHCVCGPLLVAAARAGAAAGWLAPALDAMRASAEVTP